MTDGPVASFGFRIKSGYAVVVMLAGSRQAPSAVGRRIIELSDPQVAATRQPYHAGSGKEEGDAREVARRIGIVRQCAQRAIAQLLRDVESGNPHGVRRSQPDDTPRAGLVVGSLIDPQQVANPHIRAHASEGRLFRTVVEEALQAHGVSSTSFVEKDLATTAAATLRHNEQTIGQVLDAFGKALGRPWRSDEKAAAIAAWLALD
jgi:hypothetical protein